jgi:hypothetical protein
MTLSFMKLFHCRPLRAPDSLSNKNRRYDGLASVMRISQFCELPSALRAKELANKSRRNAPDGSPHSTTNSWRAMWQAH